MPEDSSRKLHFPSLLIEFFLIVLSISLAFGINEWRDYRRQDEQRKMVLQNFVDEISLNREVEAEWLPYHQSVLRNIQELITGKSRHAGLIKKNKFQFQQIAPAGLFKKSLKSIAWETASSANVLLCFDFESTLLFSNLYQIQKKGVSSTLEMIVGLLYDRATFDKQAV